MGSEVERLREKVDSLRRVQEEKEKEEEEVEGAEDMIIGNQGADGEFVQVESLSRISLLILGSDDFFHLQHSKGKTMSAI